MSPRKRTKYPPRHASDTAVHNARGYLKLHKEGTVDEVAKYMGSKPTTARQALKQIGAVLRRYVPREGRGALKKVWGLP